MQRMIDQQAKEEGAANTGSSIPTPPPPPPAAKVDQLKLGPTMKKMIDQQESENTLRKSAPAA